MSIVWCLKVFVSILRRVKTRRCFCFRESTPLLAHGDHGSVMMSIARNTATWSKTVHCPITWDQALVKVLWLKVRRRPPLATLPHQQYSLCRGSCSGKGMAGRWQNSLYREVNQSPLPHFLLSSNFVWVSMALAFNSNPLGINLSDPDLERGQLGSEQDSITPLIVLCIYMDLPELS